MWTHRIIGILWPAFMAACLLEVLVFAVADPLDLHWGGEPLGWSRQAIYTAGFFSFWAISLAACASTTLLRMTPAEINECPFAPEARPEGCPGRK
jgi:hypothetical protein